MFFGLSSPRMAKKLLSKIIVKTYDMNAKHAEFIAETIISYPYDDTLNTWMAEDKRIKLKTINRSILHFITSPRKLYLTPHLLSCRSCINDIALLLKPPKPSTILTTLILTPKETNEENENKTD